MYVLQRILCISIVMAIILIILVNYIKPAIKVATNDSYLLWDAAEETSHILKECAYRIL